MGSCTTKAKKIEYSVKLSDVPYKSDSNYTIKIIQPSLFYNLAVKDLNKQNSNQLKENEYIDFRDKKDFTINHLRSSMNLEFGSLKENRENLFKSLKILLDFKNLVLIGDSLVSSDNEIAENLLEFIKLLENSKININKVYILDGSITNMLNKFSFLSIQISLQIEGKSLPLMLYSDNDKGFLVRNDVTIPSRATDASTLIQGNIKKFSFETGNTVYIQDYPRFQQSYDENLYLEILGLRTVLLTFNHINLEDLKIKSNSPQKKTRGSTLDFKEKKISIISEEITNTKEIQAILKNLFLQKSPFLLVHDPKKVEVTINALISFLETRIKINSSNLRNYIEERIPKMNVVNASSMTEFKPNNDKKNKSPQKQTKLPEENLIKSRLEEINEMMFGLKKVTKGSSITFQDVSDLLSKIVDNIIKNPHEEKYRNLNGNNPKLKQSIFKFEESKKLLEIVGFIPRGYNNEVQYHNSLDVNSLKHIKVDLELGFKNAISKS